MSAPDKPRYPAREGLVGYQFGRLLVEEFAGPGKWRASVYNCKCDCGNLTQVVRSSLISGRTRSCGCFQSERTSEANTKHGHSRNKATSPTYHTWDAMIQRCTNPNNLEFNNYGGRGITVPQRWLTFENFLADMGVRPPGMFLERVKNDEGYSKQNCMWADKIAQNNNRRDCVFVEYQGQRKTVAQWAREKGIYENTLRHRIKRGWTAERALNG